MANTLKFGNGEWYGKKDTILAYNDENSNYKPLPFNFSRASSATVINKDGLIEEVGSGQPRIDYKDDSKGALLLEPSRSNVISYSEDFSNSYWNTNSNTSRSLSSNLSPEGTANAYRVEAVSGTQVGYVGVTTIGTTITHSVYVRRVSGSTTFNMVDVNNSATQVDITNEWKRFSVTAVATSTNLRSYLRLNQVGDVVEIFGFQAEQGSYATSYIPTQGSAVTRLSELSPFERTDLVSKNLVGSTEMTWFLDSYLFNRDATSVSPKISNVSNGNIFIGLNVTNDTSLNIRHKDGTSASNTSSVSFTNGQRVKVAIKIIGTSATAFINGVDVGDFTTASITSFDKFASANGNPYNINDLRFYNTALTDAELIALTQV